LVDMVFNQPETARNYARKLYRFYVNTTISQDIEGTVINGLTDDLLANGYDLKATLKMLLKSEHFYNICTDVQGGGNIIKSPLELLTEAMSFFNTDLPNLSNSPTPKEIEEHFFDFGTVYFYDKYGQDVGFFLFGADDVAGHPAYYQEPDRDKIWYNGTTLAARYEIGQLFINYESYINDRLHTYIDTLAFAHYLEMQGVNVSNADAVLDSVVNYLFPNPITADRRDLIKEIFLNGLSPINWQFEWQFYLEDGDEDRVRPHLDALVVAVLSAREFQLK